MESKKHNVFIIAVIVLLLLSLILCATAIGLWMHGKHSMTQSTETPTLPQHGITESEVSSKSDMIEYNGKRYRYNDEIINILLLGIDSESNPADAAGNTDFSDVIVLAALNMRDNKMTLISLSRNIMCDIELQENTSDELSLIHTQLALSYAYGDGQHGSCEVTKNAVSNIFFGLPIQGYAAYYFNGIGALNDVVGGVTVEIPDDFPFSAIKGKEHMKAGNTITLNAEEAVLYVFARNEFRDDANELRMLRQKQYMLNLISKAKNIAMNNPTSILSMYDAVDEYLLTNLGISEISYLATQAINMEFDSNIHNLPGEIVARESDGITEYYIDQNALFNLMVDIFYTEIT